ncbi:transposase, partial [Endozoicomonas sp. (ex Bugula neritina AB1)]
MSENKSKSYTSEFRENAVQLAVESDKPVTETAKELGVNVNTLHTWIAKYHRPKAASKPQKNDEHIYDELKRLRKEVSKL